MRTGVFPGQARAGVRSGTWRKPGGTSPLPFALAEAPAAAQALDGFRCTTKQIDRKYGWTYAYALKLQASRGDVRGFEARTQACRPIGG